MNEGIKSISKKERGDILIVFNIPKDSKLDSMMDYCKRFDDKIELEYPYQLFSEMNPVALLKFSNKQQIKFVQRRIDNTEINGSIIQARRLSAMALNQKEKNQCRLIIHNLSFKAKENDIFELFHFFGPIEEIYIPKKDAKHMKGYAFVQYIFQNDSKDAVLELNGKVIIVYIYIYTYIYIYLNRTGK